MGGRHLIERLISASPETLFQAHAEAACLARWFPPPSARNLGFDLDFRAGGSLRYGLGGTDGSAVWGRCDYLSVDAPQHIDLLQFVTDPTGNAISPLANSDWLLIVRSEIRFRRRPTGTLLEIEASVHRPKDDEGGFFEFTWPLLRTEFEASLDRLEFELRPAVLH